MQATRQDNRGRTKCFLSFLLNKDVYYPLSSNDVFAHLRSQAPVLSKKVTWNYEITAGSYAAWFTNVGNILTFAQMDKQTIKLALQKFELLSELEKPKLFFWNSRFPFPK